jgi:hypothetical protein
VARKTGDFAAALSAPKQLVPSLLHIGLQNITSLTFDNQGHVPYGPAEVRLSIPELSAEPVRVPVPLLVPGQRAEFKQVAFPYERLDHWRIAGLMQRDDGLPCKLEAVSDSDEVLACRDVSVLPPNAWEFGRYPEALAAFVHKESRAIAKLHEASRPFLRDLLGTDSFADARELPLAKYPDRNEHMVQAFYRAMQESFQLHYEYEVRTYPSGWQKIRFHDRVLAEAHGTCIDFALLLMACLERVHLDPLIVLVQTGPGLQHAIVGCWMGENKERSVVIRKHGNLARWARPPTGSGDLLLIDATGYTVERGWPFSRACAEALGTFTKATKLASAVNVARARIGQGKRKAISPMPFGDGPHLSGEGWAVIRCAEDAATEFRYDRVERAHLFWALLEMAPELAREAFADSAPVLQVKIEERLRKKAPALQRGVAFQTKSFQKSMQRAGELADTHASGSIGPLQILHAVLDDPGDTVNRVLRDLGVNTTASIDRLTELARRDPRRGSYLEFKSSHPGQEK